MTDEQTGMPARSTTRGGLALLALALGGFTIGTTEFATMGLLPLVAGDLGISIPTAGHVITAYALGVVVARRCSRRSRRASTGACCCSGSWQRSLRRTS